MSILEKVFIIFLSDAAADLRCYFLNLRLSSIFSL